jgi:hypothetical protein
MGDAKQSSLKGRGTAVRSSVVEGFGTSMVAALAPSTILRMVPLPFREEIR